MKVSVVIPTYNDHLALSLTLEGYAAQSFLADDYEIIIVDDGSKESYLPLINSFKRRIKNIRLYSQEQKGRSSARNLGIKNAVGEIIILNDADRIPERDFIEKHYKTNNKIDNSIIIGSVKEIYFTNIKEKKKEILNFINNKSNLAKTIKIHKQFYSLFDKNGMTDSSIAWLATFSGNMSIKKIYLEKFGLFDENFKKWGFEHFELGYRLMNAGMKFQVIDAQNYHIAHKRESGFMLKEMEESHKYFYQKHNDAIILHLMKLFKSEISLEEFELLGNGGDNNSLLLTENRNYIKILN